MLNSVHLLFSIYYIRLKESHIIDKNKNRTKVSFDVFGIIVDE